MNYEESLKGSHFHPLLPSASHLLLFTELYLYCKLCYKLTETILLKMFWELGIFKNLWDKWHLKIGWQFLKLFESIFDFFKRSYNGQFKYTRHSSLEETGIDDTMDYWENSTKLKPLKEWGLAHKMSVLVQLQVLGLGIW